MDEIEMFSLQWPWCVTPISNAAGMVGYAKVVYTKDMRNYVKQQYHRRLERGESGCQVEEDWSRPYYG